MPARKSKVITDIKEINKLKDLKSEDITTSYIMEMFGEFNNKCKYHPYDIVTIPPGFYGPEGKKNKNSFVTTIGIFIANKYLFEDSGLFNDIKYINKSINKKLFEKINVKLSYALTEDRITTDDIILYLNKCQKFMGYVSILTPSYTDKMLTCTKVINKKKEELIKKYKTELENGNGIVSDKIEKELLDYALGYMKDDPSMDIYLSGFRGSISNNFKNIFVMKGAIKDPDPNAKQKYQIATSNYMDGVDPKDYSLYAKSLAAGPFARARKTAKGGYWEKLMVSALQDIVLQEPGSDCGTTRTISVKLTDENISLYMYSYIVDRGGNLIELTSENMDRYIGKTVNFRFSALCESKDGICNKCMGNLMYRIGLKNVGVASPQIASKLKTISMKAFHDSTQKFVDMPLDKVF